MAIVRYFGRPSLFITLTVNPNWPKILRELANYPRLTANDRFDIIVRVFRMKVQRLLWDIRHGNCFGRFVANVWAIEYQKRGLPHVHILIFLHSEDREQLLNPDNIDKIVSVELPTPEEDPDGTLRRLVESVMIHGPCGNDNPVAPCMASLRSGRSNVCTKRYPREFKDNTVVEEDGYPLYRRHDNGQRVTK